MRKISNVGFCGDQDRNVEFMFLVWFAAIVIFLKEIKKEEKNKRKILTPKKEKKKSKIRIEKI